MLMAGTLRDLKETVQLRELGRNHDPRSHSFLPVSQPHLLLPTTPSGSDFPQVSTNTEKKQPIFIKRSIILQKKKKISHGKFGYREPLFPHPPIFP